MLQRTAWQSALLVTLLLWAPVQAQQSEPPQQASGGGPLITRSQPSIQGLFAKGTVTGSELVAELVALRTLMAGKRSAQAVGALLGAAAPEGAKAFDPQGELIKLALKGAEEAVKPYVTAVGFGALDLHLRTMIDDPNLLASETIKLPSSKDMNAAQAQRVINMAAIVVATRVTGKMLAKAQADFANVENDYTQLIASRENVAKLLYDVLLKAGGAAGAASPELEGLYTEEDLAYLRSNVTRMSVADFAADLGAQNLALRYLRKSDPAAWTDYKARSDGLRSSTKGYIRATAGVTAFAALLATFGQETIGAARNKRGGEIILALPFAWEFIKEVPPLLKVSWQVGAAGVIELPMRSARRFRVIEGASVEEFGKVSDVVASIKKRNAESLLHESLFRTGADGLLYKLFRCDRSEVGRMMDTAVPSSQRERFATDLALTDAPRFSFANAFSDQAENPRERELGDELLRKDHRQSSEVRALGEAQRAATQGYARWNSDQFLRMILANREGAAALATLQLGEVLVRPIPSMQSVFAYESLVDECAKQFGGGPVAAAAPAAAPAPPGRQSNPPAARPPAKR
jgi:hypothetical protein